MYTPRAGSGGQGHDIWSGPSSAAIFESHMRNWEANAPPGGFRKTSCEAWTQKNSVPMYTPRAGSGGQGHDIWSGPSLAAIFESRMRNWEANAPFGGFRKTTCDDMAWTQAHLEVSMWTSKKLQEELIEGSADLEACEDQLDKAKEQRNPMIYSMVHAQMRVLRAWIAAIEDELACRVISDVQGVAEPVMPSTAAAATALENTTDLPVALELEPSPPPATVAADANPFHGLTAAVIKERLATIRSAASIGLQGPLEAAIDAMTEAELELETLNSKEGKSRNMRRKVSCLKEKTKGMSQLKQSLTAELAEIKARVDAQ